MILKKKSKVNVTWSFLVKTLKAYKMYNEGLYDTLMAHGLKWFYKFIKTAITRVLSYTIHIWSKRIVKAFVYAKNFFNLT